MKTTRSDATDMAERNFSIRVHVRAPHGEVMSDCVRCVRTATTRTYTMNTTILALDLGTTTGWALRGNVDIL